MTYRVGNHQPQNVYRDDAYIGVMFTAEDAALVVEALNDARPNSDLIVDISETAIRAAAAKVRAIRPGLEAYHALAAIQALLVMGWRPEPTRKREGQP